MGLYVCVYMHEYDEWVRAHAVTPTANQRDFTCTLVDYGHKKNVKVEDTCFLHTKFAAYPRLARECILEGIRPFIGDKFKPPAIAETRKFFFGEKGSEDDPSSSIQLAVNFLSWRDERAYVEIIDLNRPDVSTNEAKTVQIWLNEKRMVKLDERYVHMNDGLRLGNTLN